MLILLMLYFIYLVLYALVSYAIIFHLTRYRIDGDKSSFVLMLYIIVSVVIVVGSISFLRPI